MEKKNEVTKAKKTDEELNGIVITDAGLDEVATKQELKKVENFVILGEIEVSDCEKKFLSVHYKCRVRKHMTLDEIDVEVNKLDVKNRYEKKNHGDQ